MPSISISARKDAKANWRSSLTRGLNRYWGLLFIITNVQYLVIHFLRGNAALVSGKLVVGSAIFCLVGMLVTTLVVRNSSNLGQAVSPESAKQLLKNRIPLFNLYVYISVLVFTVNLAPGFHKTDYHTGDTMLTGLDYRLVIISVIGGLILALALRAYYKVLDSK